MYATLFQEPILLLKSFPLSLLSFLLGGGNESEAGVAGNLKDELRVGLSCASNTLRDVCAQPSLTWTENGQWKLSKLVLSFRTKSRSSKFGNKVWNRYPNKSTQNFII